MLNFIPSAECTGCSACYSICSNNSITFCRNAEGFFSPSIDFSKCVKCYTCISVCPINKRKNKYSNKDTEHYEAWSLDEKMRDIGSSGGIVPLIASHILDLGGVVFGAHFDLLTKTVTHTYIRSTCDLEDITRSKYVESNLNGTFANVKKMLGSGMLVMFVGTPCQVDGLYSFLNKRPSNLLTVDFYCHGVPSSKLFSEHMKRHVNIEEVRMIYFRNKKHEIPPNDKFNLECIGENDEQIYLSPAICDDYYLSFIAGLSLKESCYKCKYLTKIHPSDITVGDFKRKLSVKYDINYDYPSIISLNTKLGIKIHSELKNKIFSRNLEKFEYDEYYSPRNLQSGLWQYDIDGRKNFFDLYVNCGYNEAMKYMYNRVESSFPTGIIKNNKCKKPIALFGAGGIGMEALTLFGRDIVKCFIDNDKRKSGKFLLGVPIISYSEFKKRKEDLFVILCVNNENAKSISSDLENDEIKFTYLSDYQ